MSSTPSCEPATTLRPFFTISQLNNSSSKLSHCPTILFVVKFKHPSVPSPLEITISFLPSPAYFISLTKSTKGLCFAHSVCARVSQIFTHPSSSPVAIRCSFSVINRLIATVCAFLSLATTAPVTTSVATTHASAPPLSSVFPPSTYASVLHVSPACTPRSVSSFAHELWVCDHCSTSPLISPTAKTCVVGANATSNGCSAHSARHASPPSSIAAFASITRAREATTEVFDARFTVSRVSRVERR